MEAQFKNSSNPGETSWQKLRNESLHWKLSKLSCSGQRRMRVDEGWLDNTSQTRMNFQNFNWLKIDESVWQSMNVGGQIKELEPFFYILDQAFTLQQRFRKAPIFMLLHGHKNILSLPSQRGCMCLSVTIYFKYSNTTIWRTCCQFATIIVHLCIMLKYT